MHSVSAYHIAAPSAPRMGSSAMLGQRLSTQKMTRASSEGRVMALTKVFEPMKTPISEAPASNRGRQPVSSVVVGSSFSALPSARASSEGRVAAMAKSYEKKVSATLVNTGGVARGLGHTPSVSNVVTFRPRASSDPGIRSVPKVATQLQHKSSAQLMDRFVVGESLLSRKSEGLFSSCTKVLHRSQACCEAFGDDASSSLVSASVRFLLGDQASQQDEHFMFSLKSAGAFDDCHIVLACLYLQKAFLLTDDKKLTTSAWRTLFALALTVADKFWSDNPAPPQLWKQVAEKEKVASKLGMELEFMALLQWRLSVTFTEYHCFCMQVLQYEVSIGASARSVLKKLGDAPVSRMNLGSLLKKEKVDSASHARAKVAAKGYDTSAKIVLECPSTPPSKSRQHLANSSTKSFRSQSWDTNVARTIC